MIVAPGAGAGILWNEDGRQGASLEAGNQDASPPDSSGIAPSDAPPSSPVLV